MGYRDIPIGDLSEKEIEIAGSVIQMLRSLQYRTGRATVESPVDVFTLSRMLSRKAAYMIREDDVRDIVAYLRRKGELVGSNSRGYFLAKSAADIDRTITRLSDVNQSITEMISAMQASRHKLEAKELSLTAHSNPTQEPIPAMG